MLHTQPGWTLVDGLEGILQFIHPSQNVGSVSVLDGENRGRRMVAAPLRGFLVMFDHQLK